MSLLKQHLSSLPNDLVDELQIEFQKIHTQYFLGHWEPSELDGGRLIEMVLRIIEYKDMNTFTPIGKPVNRQTIVLSAEQNTTLEDSWRFHIPRLAGVVLDFRNKRNVGHVGLINVNEMDSTFVLQAANWIVAELIRLETQMSPNDAQAEIKKIIERKVPIIEEIGGRLKCLSPKLKVEEAVLIFCYQRYPAPVSLDDLFGWTAYSNKTTLKNKLIIMDKKTGYIDFRNGEVLLTKKGVLWVEKYLPFHLEV